MTDISPSEHCLSQSEPAPHDVATAVTLEGVTKRFGSIDALTGLSLRVPQGSVFGLLGRNGAGKTTAVRILATLLRPTSGRVDILGIDVQRHPQAVREVIGLAGQHAAVDENLTARENLRLLGGLSHLPKRVVGPRADELLERFQLQTVADRIVATLSGGMRRRLDLASALVNKPSVLLLDEPTTGLDPHSRRELWNTIDELVSEGMTLLLTTQYLEEADRLAHRIAFVDQGRVVAEGTTESLKSSLGSTVLEIGLEPRDIATAYELLYDYGHISALDGGRGISMLVEGGADASVDVIWRIDTARIRMTSLTVREPTLDQIFFRLTEDRDQSRGNI
jgi:daunorubicin resistance ABC transporter ATP-binding subunit